MRSLEEIYIANGQDPRMANRTGKLEYDDRFGCMVWTPAQFLGDAKAESDSIGHGKATKTTKRTEGKAEEPLFLKGCNQLLTIRNICNTILKQAPEAAPELRQQVIGVADLARQLYVKEQKRSHARSSS